MSNECPDVIYLIDGDYDGEPCKVWSDDPEPGLGNELDDAVEYVKASKICGGWISVDDMLPDPSGQWVLVCADGAINCMGYCKKNGFEFWPKGSEMFSNIRVHNITHWMPLPVM